jgi:hypothetical protein
MLEQHVAGGKRQNELCRDGTSSESKRVLQISFDCDWINSDRVIFRDKLYASKLPDDV